MSKEDWELAIKHNKTRVVLGTIAAAEAKKLFRGMLTSIVDTIDHGFAPNVHAVRAIGYVCPDAVDKLEELYGLDLSSDALEEAETRWMRRFIESEVESNLNYQLERLRRSYARRKAYTSAPVLCPRPLDYPPVPVLYVEASKDGFGLPEKPGIYFVWDEGSVVYVGQSINIKARARLGNHTHIRVGETIGFLEFPLCDLLFAECHYIGACRPIRNFGEFQRKLERRAMLRGNQDTTEGEPCADGE